MQPFTTSELQVGLSYLTGEQPDCFSCQETLFVGASYYCL